MCPPSPSSLPAAFHYKQVLGLWHQGCGVTFKPTTEPWSSGGGEPELEVLLIMVDPLKGGTGNSPWRYMPQRFGSQQNGLRENKGNTV